MPLPVAEKHNAPWFFAQFSEAFPNLPAHLTLEDSELSHRLKTVMRLRPGEAVVLVNEAQQQPYFCTVQSAKGALMTFEVLDRLPVSPSPGTSIIAAVSLLKGSKWDWMLQKLVELGISEIRPLKTHRTVIDIKDSAAKHGRWLQIVRQAAEQSEQTRMPLLHPVQALGDWVASCSANIPSETLKLAAVERHDQPLSAILSGLTYPQRLLFAIGPEGGWDPSEIELLQGGGFYLVSLGDKILRSETAALYCASVIQYATSSTYVNPR